MTLPGLLILVRDPCTSQMELESCPHRDLSPIPLGPVTLLQSWGSCSVPVTSQPRFGPRYSVMMWMRCCTNGTLVYI